MRNYCSVCAYPQRTCVCDAVHPIHVPVNLVILQHQQEATHAKNTARLVKLAIPDTQIIAGDSQSLYQQAADLIFGTSAALIYPDDNSKPVETLRVSDVPVPDTLIFIDASWRQAFGIRQRAEWLKHLPAFHFSHAGASQYRIRHTDRSDSLSTLEAVAYCLETLTDTDCQTLLTLQDAMQRHWQAPVSHQRKIISPSE